jgi:hypothetical protein
MKEDAVAEGFVRTKSIRAVVQFIIWLFCMVRPGEAWNRTGHEAIAYIAYSRLTSTARKQVARLLRAHPDYDRLAGGALGTSDETITAFLSSSTWPDSIRDDPRFHNDNDPPTPLLSGFPDMGRHQMWHYIDIPFSTDSTPVPASPPAPNVLTQIGILRQSIADTSIPESIRAYQLSWVVHLIGDVHQPMHCVTRFLQTQRDPQTGSFIGDMGGNLVFVEEGKTLHAYWDDLLGEADDAVSIEAVAKDLLKSEPSQRALRLNEQEWVREGFDIGRKSAYKFDGGHSKDHPAKLGAHYRTEALGIAKKRAALAAYRLAAVLNEAFQATSNP